MPKISDLWPDPGIIDSASLEIRAAILADSAFNGWTNGRVFVEPALDTPHASVAPAIIISAIAIENQVFPNDLTKLTVPIGVRVCFPVDKNNGDSGPPTVIEALQRLLLAASRDGSVSTMSFVSFQTTNPQLVERDDRRLWIVDTTATYRRRCVGG